MDRFIADYNSKMGTTLADLKSNMDRFIATAVEPSFLSMSKFKIQYG